MARAPRRRGARRDRHFGGHGSGDRGAEGRAESPRAGRAAGRAQRGGGGAPALPARRGRGVQRRADGRGRLPRQRPARGAAGGAPRRRQRRGARVHRGAAARARGDPGARGGGLRGRRRRGDRRHAVRARSGRAVPPLSGRATSFPAVAATVIKLGSSIVADERGEVREDVLAGVCDQVAEIYRDGRRVVLVTSGAIARGMNLMRLPMRPTGMADLQAASAVGQGKLYRAYDELLAARGLSSAQVLLTFFDMSARSHYLNARQTLRKLLEWGIVPVINENDTTATDEITFGDNDFLAAQVAILLGASELLLLTDTDGLFTADPRVDPSARLVAEGSDFAGVERLETGMWTSPLGSGGRRSKVGAAEMATAGGIPAVILNGTRSDAVLNAVSGRPEGTRFHPQAQRVSSFKLWLKYAKPSHGRLVVDAGAERALRERGTSLLPVGVVDVEGEFRAGDAVDVVTDGHAIGKGIVNYSAAELRRVKGLKTDAVGARMPGAAEEAVHRDYFVLD